jgi:ATP-binding cassette subfamily F protein 3
VVEIRKGKIKNFPGGIEYYLRKREQISDELRQKETLKESEQKTRKDQKRVEAEFRQKRYDATKDLIKKVEMLEKKIAELEEKEKITEKELTLPETYTNPEKAKEKSKEFRNIKSELEIYISEWEKASTELHKIEQMFN